MILWRRSGSSALSVRPQHHLHGMSTPSGCPLPTPAIAWWIIRFNTGFSDDDSIHACHEWQLTCFQFPRCLLSPNGYSVLQDRWSRLRENGCKQILSEQRGAFHRGRRVGPLNIQIDPNKSKCAQMNSNQIQIESSVSKSNPTRVNLIWIYLLTSLVVLPASCEGERHSSISEKIK
jgi:hypothetical protein